jgi:hypothetical protein
MGGMTPILRAFETVSAARRYRRHRDLLEDVEEWAPLWECAME